MMQTPSSVIIASRLPLFVRRYGTALKIILSVELALFVWLFIYALGFSWMVTIWFMGIFAGNIIGFYGANLYSKVPLHRMMILKITHICFLLFLATYLMLLFADTVVFSTIILVACVEMVCVKLAKTIYSAVTEAEKTPSAGNVELGQLRFTSPTEQPTHEMPPLPYPPQYPPYMMPGPGPQGYPMMPYGFVPYTPNPSFNGQVQPPMSSVYPVMYTEPPQQNEPTYMFTPEHQLTEFPREFSYNDSIQLVDK